MDRNKIDKMLNEEFVVSYSDLKEFAIGGIKGYVRYKTKRKDAVDNRKFAKGQAFDLRLTEPEKYGDQIVVFAGDYPNNGTIYHTFIDYLIKLSYDGYLYEDAIVEAHRLTGFKRKGDTITKVKEEFENKYFDYYKTYLDNKDKYVITVREEMNIEDAVKSLKKNEASARFVDVSDPNEELLKQCTIDWYLPPRVSTDGKKIKVKSKYDKIILNHKYKIVDSADLKTTSKPIASFYQSVIDYRYDIQAALYFQGLRYKYGGQYRINPFCFIVENIHNPGYPKVFQVPDYVIERAFMGGRTHYGKKLVGIYQLIDDLYWHYKNDEWETDREVIENNGRIILDF